MKSAAGAVALALVLILGTTVTSFASAQQDGSQGTAAALRLDVQVAASAQAYSSGLLKQASIGGLNVTSAVRLIAAGNSSLESAQAELSSGGNTTAGIQEALSAVSSYNTASATLSISLQDAGLAGSVDVETAAGAVASLNATAGYLSSAIAYACSNTSVNSSLLVAFMQDCANGKSEVADSFAALAEASTSGSVSSSSAFIAQAKGNLSDASSVVSQLAGYSYSARASAFISSEMAGEISLANATVATQQRLSSEYDSLASSYQSNSTMIDNDAANLALSVSAVTHDISAVDFGPMNADITTQQTVLTGIGSNLTLLSQQLPVSLPSATLSALRGDVTAAQTSLSTYSQDLKDSAGYASTFSQFGVESFAGNSSRVVGQTEVTEQDGMAFEASLSALQGELSTVAGQFPLLTILATWSGTVRTEVQSTTTASMSLNASFNTVTTELETLATDLSTMHTAALSAVFGSQVSTGLVNSAASFSASEAGLLNSSGISKISQAATALQDTANATSAFAASAYALVQLQVQIGQIPAMSSSLSSEAASLQTQIGATTTLVSSASAAIAGDLSFRAQAQASAQADIQQALSLFGEQEVASGIALLAEASVSLQVAAQTG